LSYRRRDTGMQAIIFGELKKYAEARLGDDAWRPLLREAGVTRHVYAPGQDYPDEEVGAIVAAASKKTGLEADAILQDFGEFIVPDLVRLYRHIIDPEWKTLDLIEHTEQTIHRAVRRDHPAASPPQLKCVRKAPDEVIIRELGGASGTPPRPPSLRGSESRSARGCGRFWALGRAAHSGRACLMSKGALAARPLEPPLAPRE
jgi:hypothetical protein